MKKSCDFFGAMYGAHYPDAECNGSGYLIDLDADYIKEDIPCPKCNFKEFAEYAGIPIHSGGNARQRRINSRYWQRRILAAKDDEA